MARPDASVADESMSKQFRLLRSAEVMNGEKTDSRDETLQVRIIDLEERNSAALTEEEIKAGQDEVCII